MWPASWQRTGPRSRGSRRADCVFGDAGPGRGTFAEFCCVDDGHLAKFDKSKLSFSEASALGLAGLTAIQGLRTHGGLRPGGRVVVTAGGGGVGTFAIQVAKAFGASMVLTTSSRSADLCKSLGADHVVNHRTQDWAHEALRVSGGESWDVVLSCTPGYDEWVRGQQVLQGRGTFVTLTGDAEVKGLGDVASMVLGIGNRKFWSIFGYTSYKLFLTEAGNTADIELLRDLAESRKVRPVIDMHFPFTSQGVADMYAKQESGTAVGKLVLDVAAE